MMSHHRRLRIATAVAGLGALLLLGPPPPGSGQGTAPATDWQAFQKTVRPFLARHCFDCHTDKARGGVRLDQFDEKAIAQGSPTLGKVLDVLGRHAMPPRKRPQPGAAELEPVLAWLEAYAERRERETARSERVLLRRLNRAEYNNTVRDLLGVDFQPADDFPQDVSGHGFDNIAGTLSVSPVLMEKYLAAAEKVARTAVFGVAPMKPERVVHEPWFAADAFSKNNEVKFDYDETGMSLPSAFHVVQRFAADGEYTFRGILRGVRPAGSDPVELAFWIDGKMVHTARIAVPTKSAPGRNAGELNGLWAEFRTPVKAGEHWLSVTILRMYEGLPAAYKGPKPARAQARAANNRGVDAFFVMYLHVVGPYQQAKGPSQESIKKVFGDNPVKGPQDAAVRKILADLARRAYRRPVTGEEVDELVNLVAMVQKDGESFEEGLCLALQRLLISPHFLFRVEKAPLTQHELATRLSYFLWSSMPDEELFRCADEGKLRQPEVLAGQVRRMLKDARARALVANFGGQWLRTRALESHTPDRTRFPEFTDYTRMSMKQETERFFEHILRADRPVLDFLDANYTFLNQRLAEFYGIPGVKGHEFRKVDLAGSGRGGVWRQASVLTVSSYPNRTSPVLRGKWILENLLGAPPPPPPPDVPALDEKEVGKTVSLGEQLRKHRSNATCASCHARMDPLGLALEHFDATGRWRSGDGKLAIEDSTTLADGNTVQGPDGLAAYLKADPKAFAECLAEKMLIYALGRGLGRNDRKTVKAVAERMAREDYRFSSLVLGIVESEPFRGRDESGGTR
jgi:mono/diheme cytochrome c family protein